MSYNPDQPRDAQGRWGSGGFSAKGVTLKGVPQAKDKSQETAQYYANRAAFHAGKHHEHVQAYHAATTAEEKSAHALKAQASLKYLKQNVKWAGEAAKSGDEAHVAAAKLMQMKAELHHEGVTATEKAKSPKVAKVDAAQAASHLAEKAENESTGAYFTGEAKSHVDAAKAHATAATAYSKLGMSQSAKYHQQKAYEHQEKADQLEGKGKGKEMSSADAYKLTAIAGKENTVAAHIAAANAHHEMATKFAESGLIPTSQTHEGYAAQHEQAIKDIAASKNNEKAIADMKAKMDAGKKGPDPDAESKAENKLKNAQAYHDSAVEHMKNKHYDSAAENFAKAKTEAEEAMKLSANPDKTSKIYPQAMKLKDAAHTKMFDAKQAENEAKALKQKAGEKDGIVGLHKINEKEYEAGFKAESLDHFQARRKEYTKALTMVEKDGTYEYSTGSYTRINGALQKGVEPPEMKGIDKALARPEAGAPHDMVLHRSTYAKYYPDMKEGSVVSYDGYSSTTVDKKVADSWGGDVMLHISVPKGHPAAPIPSAHPHEQERLLPRGQKMRITKIEKGASGKVHVHVEVLPHDFEEAEAARVSKKAGKKKAA